MKITLLTSDLSKGLNIANRFVSHKGQLPILANILISASESGIFLGATNLEVGVRVNLPGKVTEVGEITTPARNFSEFISSVNAEQITLETTDTKIKISAGKYKADFLTIAAVEFPVIPKIDSLQKNAVQTSLITQLANQIAFAASLDESRPVLTGIKLSLSDSGMVAIGTDGFRLSKKHFSLDSKLTSDTSIVLPARTISELAKILADTMEDKLEIANISENNQIVFITSRVELFSRVLEGNYPDVDKIIPREFNNQILVDRQEFARALRTAAIFARESNNIIRFLIEPERMQIKANSSSSGETAVDLEVDGQAQGEIIFNYKYVADFLGSVTGERVVIKFNEATTPVLFADEKDDSYLHIVMPIRS